MKRHSIEEGNELPAGCIRSSLSTTKRQRDVVIPAASVDNAPVWKQTVQAQRTQKSQNSQKSAALRPGSSNPTQVLLVRVSHITHPVTIDALHRIFSRYGEVCKVVTFDKGSGFQALIQFRSVQEAIRAHSKADGMCMYPGCNHIRVGFSNQSEITVKKTPQTNSERGWDYMQERAQSGPPIPFVGEENAPQQQTEVPYLLPSPISAFPLLLQQHQMNGHQQRLHPQHQGPHYPMGHYPPVHLQQQYLRQYTPHVQYAVVPVPPPPSGPLYYPSQVMNHYAPSSQPLPSPAIGCSELSWQDDIRLISNAHQCQHQEVRDMRTVPIPPQLQGNLSSQQNHQQWQNSSTLQENNNSTTTCSLVQGVSTQNSNEIGILQSHVGTEEQWQSIGDGGRGCGKNNVVVQQQSPDNEEEEDDKYLVDSGGGVSFILDPPQLSKLAHRWTEENDITTEHGQTAIDADKLAVATAKVSFIDEEEEVVYTKVEEEDLSIEGSSGKPTQTKDGGTSTVVRHQEVEPQEEFLIGSSSEDVECPWEVADDMAQKDGYTTILLVQGFNALCVKASAIAQLFGCYGDVLKVVVNAPMHQNGGASAIVRMRHAAQAQQAVKWLDGQPLGGSKISVVAVTATDSEVSSDAVDITYLGGGDTTWFYRFSETKGPGDKRYQEALCPPSPVVVLHSLPEESTDETLASLVEPIGGLISVNKGTDTETRTAILQFDRLESAIHALIITHGLSWNGNRLKASFMNPCLYLLGE